MPAAEIAEVFVRIMAEILRWLWQAILEFVLFNLGRFGLLMVSLGRYPRGQALERDAGKISGAGVLILFLIWLMIALYNNYR